MDYVRTRCLTLVVTLSTAWLLGATASAATTYNAVTNYAITANPSGAWSYMSGGALLTVPTINFLGIKGLWDWSNGVPICNDAQIDRNSTKKTIDYYTIVLSPKFLRLDPQNTSDATVRFQAPGAGLYSIKGSFLGIDTGEQGHPVAILYNGTTKFSGSIATFSQSLPFKLKLTLAAGDNVDFMVQTNNACENLSTGLAVTIKGP